MHEQFQRAFLSPTTGGVHHLALYTDDMKATIDFYVEVLGMPLVHAMKVPPGLGAPLLNGGAATPMRASAGSGWKGISSMTLTSGTPTRAPATTTRKGRPKGSMVEPGPVRSNARWVSRAR